MYILRTSAVAATVLTLALTGPTLKASDKDKAPARITVTFGTGNNNAQAGNTPNHHILPQEFTVRITSAKKLDGTVVQVPASVNFIVSGFHWPWVYNDGVTLAEVQSHIPAAGTFVNYNVDVFAKGINPGNPPTFADAGTLVPPTSGAQNRTDSFAFSAPGDYLVICNVRGHFLDGMYAMIHVVPENAKDNDKGDKDDRGHQGHDHSK
jgi:hypothetical protein